MQPIGSTKSDPREWMRAPTLVTQILDAKARVRHRFESESSESRELAARGESVGWRLEGDANVPVRANSISIVAAYLADRAAILNGIFHRHSFVMVCHGCSVHSHWYGSVHHVVGREPSADPQAKQAKQVTVASSMIPQEINDRLSSAHNQDTLSEMIMPSNRKRPSATR